MPQNNANNHNYVTIFDTTLRDGEQSPGATMNLSEKLEVAHALRDLGVDVIEAGFPIASPGDFEEVQAIAREVQGPTICALARCIRGDIERAWDAIRDAENKRIHVFLATSAIHRQHKLKMAKDEIVRHTIEGIKLAKEYCSDVEFSPEDAARTELEFLCEVVEKAIDAGATTINIPDTVGYAMPGAFATVIRTLRDQISTLDRATLSVHCHNDLGLAVANSLAAVEAGARQVECTINGIGERAGNCSLEEVVMALHTRSDHFGLVTGIDTKRLYPTSRLVANATRIDVQRNKAIVGKNAFAHEAGIHQHGMLEHRGTYEIMRPEDVGMPEAPLVLGKHSGRHALRQRVKELGYHLGDIQLQRVFEDFKRLADKKKDIYDGDIVALIECRIHATAPNVWKIVAVNTSGGAGTMPMAAVRMKHVDGHVAQEAACGDGPVDAVFKAIERITGIAVKLSDYRVQSVSIGKDSQGEAAVEVEHGGRTYRSRAASTDIIEASAIAFVSAVNRILQNSDTSADSLASSANL